MEATLVQDQITRLRGPASQPASQGAFQGSWDFSGEGGGRGQLLSWGKTSLQLHPTELASEATVQGHFAFRSNNMNQIIEQLTDSKKVFF